MKKDTKDIAKGALTNFSGILLGTLNILFYIFLGRTYGAETVGIFVFARSSVDIVSKLGILGLDMGVLTAAAKSHAKEDSEAIYSSTGQALTMGVLATIIVLALFEVALVPISAYFPEKRDFILPLRIMGLAMVFWTISSILLFATRALRIMKYEVIVKNGVEPGVIFLAAALLYPFKTGVLGISLAFLLSVAVGTAASCYFFSKEYSFRKVVPYLRLSTDGKKLLRFSAPIGIYNTLDLLLQRIDLLILTQFAGAATVGVYSMVQNTAFVFKKIRQSFDPIIVPVISASHEVRNTSGLLLQYQNVTRWILTLNTLFFGLTFFAAETIMGIFGSEFVSGTLSFIILTAAIMVNTALGVSELFILIVRPVINLINTVLAIIAAAIFSFLFIPRYGISGAAFAMLISYTLLNVTRLIEVYRIYSLHPFTKYHMRVVYASASAFFLTLLFRAWIDGGQWVAPASAFVFLTLYSVLLALLGMAPEEKNAVTRSLLFSRRVFKKRVECCSPFKKSPDK